MAKKNRNSIKPIEQHDTAASANIEKVLPESYVPVPSLFNVDKAKDWVDDNQK